MRAARVSSGWRHLAAGSALALHAFHIGVAWCEQPRLPVPWPAETDDGPTGTTIAVAVGGDLQDALERARPGDVITLQAGATYEGAFTLPRKGGQGWITIRSSAADRDLPAPGTRVTPAHAPRMPKIVGTWKPGVALQTAPGAHHFRIVGIEFKPAAGVFTKGLIRLGSELERTASNQPHHLVVDRCYIHGDPVVGGRRGIALNSRSTAILDSHLSDWKEAGADSQAIAGWNGPGPFAIVNNYLEGAGENLMFGGADPAIAFLVPADIEIRGNHFAKPLDWRDGAWTVKNLLELKSARRVLIEGNVFENNWVGAQDGSAVVFKSVSEEGRAPWSVTEDVTFVRNLVRHSASGIRVAGRDARFPAGRTARILIRDNLLHDVDGLRWGGGGRLFTLLEDAADLTIDHNTVDGDGSALITADGAPMARFVFSNNVAPRAEYGVKGSGTPEGVGTLAAYFPGCRFEANAIAGARPAAYPPGNFFPSTMDSVGFVDRAQGDYRLDASSPYRNAGTDGRGLGADVEVVGVAATSALRGTGRPGDRAATSLPLPRPLEGGGPKASGGAPGIVGTVLCLLLGLGAYLALGRNGQHLARPAGAAGALVLSGCWVAYQLFPFVPQFRPASLLANLVVLTSAGPWSAWRTLVSFAEWSAVSRLMEAVTGPRGARAGVLTVLLLLVGRLLIGGRALAGTELAGGILALLAWRWWRRPPGGPLSLAALLGVAVALEGLAPFQFRPTPPSIQWVPLHSRWDSDTVAALSRLLRSAFDAGAVVWLLRRSGWRLAPAGLITALGLGALQAGRAFVSGRTPDVTDPLMALLMALVLGALEGRSRPVLPARPPVSSRSTAPPPAAGAR